MAQLTQKNALSFNSELWVPPPCSLYQGNSSESQLPLNPMRRDFPPSHRGPLSWVLGTPSSHSTLSPGNLIHIWGFDEGSMNWQFPNVSLQPKPLMEQHIHISNILNFSTEESHSLPTFSYVQIELNISYNHSPPPEFFVLEKGVVIYPALQARNLPLPSSHTQPWPSPVAFTSY